MKKLGTLLMLFIFSGSANAVDLKFWKIFKKDDFIVGINYPWNHYGEDVGVSPDGKHRGFSTEEQTLDEDFAKFKKAEIGHIRLFLFADGRGQIVFGDNGNILTYQPVIEKDLESLFKIAQKHDIKLWIVLFDFYIGKPHKDGTFKNRYPEIIFSEKIKKEYFEKVLVPLLKIIEKLNMKYGKPIYAIEPMNEPENMPILIIQDPQIYSKFYFLKEWLRDIIKATKQYTSIKTTLGAASYFTLLSLWKDLEVDIWQFHFYPKLLDNHLPIEELGVEKISFPRGKIIIGELSGEYVEKISKIKKNGFAGVFFWSYKAKDGYTLNLGELKSVLERSKLKPPQ